MSRKTTPYARRPHRIAENPIGLAIANATAFNAEELRQLLAPARAAMAAMRQGQATEQDWIHLVTAASTGLSIERQGVVKGVREPLQEADQALAIIATRAMAAGRWKAPTLYAHEINTLDTLVQIHAFQLESLSWGEFKAAQAHAAADTLRRGGKVLKSITVEVHT
jgi:hypothetical protein